MAKIFRRVLREKEVRAALGWSRSTLYEKIRSAEFPAPLRDGPKLTLWFEDWVLAHQAKLLAEHKRRQADVIANAPAFVRATAARKVRNTSRRRAAARAAEATPTP